MNFDEIYINIDINYIIIYFDVNINIATVLMAN